MKRRRDNERIMLEKGKNIDVINIFLFLARV